MGFWSLLGQPKFDGLILFRNINHETFIRGLHKLHKLKDIAPVIETNGEEEYKILKFSAYYETAKFAGDQSD